MAYQAALARPDGTTPAKTPGKKHTTIVQPEVSTRRVDKFQHMNAVRDSRGVLDKDDKLILYTLATHAKQEGHDVRPGLPLLAEETGISTATLKRRVPNLVRKGYLIQVTSGKGGNSSYASLYHLALPAEIGAEVNGSPGELLGEGAGAAGGGCHTDTPNGSPGSFNGSSGSFNGSPGELTTSQENIPENIPSKDVDEATPEGQSQNQGHPAGAGPSAQEPGLVDPLAVDSLPGPSDDVLAAGVPSASEWKADWLATLPGTAQRDAAHPIHVRYRHAGKSPVLPNDSGHRSVSRYLSADDASSLASDPCLSGQVRDYLGNWARIYSMPA